MKEEGKKERVPPPSPLAMEVGRALADRKGSDGALWTMELLCRELDRIYLERLKRKKLLEGKKEKEDSR